MISNYEYFLVLAEELNISKAAERLFISHQCLSKYLKKIEDDCGVTLFQRKPTFALTYAGEVMLHSLRKIELIDKDLDKQLKELQGGQYGEVRVGISKGRIRILMPDLLQHFKERFPDAELRMTGDTTTNLVKGLLNNKYDFILILDPDTPYTQLHKRILLQESFYLVISDNMLQQYFPDNYPECKDDFAYGVDLRDFQKIPFVLNYQGFYSRDVLDKHLKEIGAALKCVNESTAMDLHHIMSAKDYAASIALTMFLPNIMDMNKNSSHTSKLNVFPIKGIKATKPLVLLYPEGKVYPEYARYAMRLAQNLSKEYSLIEQRMISTINLD